MTRAPMIVRWLPAACILLVVAHGIALWLEPAASASFAMRQAPEPKPAVAAREPKLIGGETCTGCHYMPTPLYEREGATRFVALTESHTWLEKDKHSQAFDLIDPTKSAKSKAMCDKLGIVDIREAKQCLSCHADWQYNTTASEWRSPPSRLENGVSCEACHGAASEWVIDHARADWRKLTPASKSEKGFLDVRSPAVQTQQCASCHIGDPRQQRLVTHEMYAAGHPPLPSFELMTFRAAMPPHWRSVAQKLADNKAKQPEAPSEFKFHEEYLAANPTLTSGGEFASSRAVLVSAVEAMRSSLHLVGAAEDARRLPDFALYDCYACHHDLKSSTAAPRKEARVPGRPHPHVWPNALVSAAQAYANVPTESYQKALADYHAAFDAQPFGKPELITASRVKLQAELTALIAAVEKTSADRAALIRAWDALIAPSTDATLDYDSARQIAWAMRVFSQEIDVLIHEGFLEKLHLTLPGGQKQSLTDDLPLRLKALSEFDAEAFHAELKRLPGRK